MLAHAGDWIEVRSKEEILATLDKSGRRDGLPFMPEMLEFCGRRMRISSSAHKTCGPVQGRYVALQTKDIVHLGNRCSGAAHGGCQNACQFFWHTAWLKGIEGAAEPPNSSAGCTEADVVAATRQSDLDGEPRYACQATALTSYAKPLSWWDARSYWKSYQTGNQTLRELFDGMVFLVFSKVAGHHAQRFGARKLYDSFQAWRGGRPFPRRHGKIPNGQPTPVSTLGLKPGDYVRIKSHEQILETLTYDGKNRGMFFDAELVPFCGKTYRVQAMVERFIDEEVGVMRHMKTPAAILENVYCLSLYTGKRAFCPRGYISWWREAWLERVSPEEVARERVINMRERGAARGTEPVSTPTPKQAAG
ncbi:MAG: hypothetical protein R3D57_02185 [Hyphomicrobiaceae bacterium]